MPGQVLVSRPDTGNLVELITGRLGIILKTVGKLKAAEAFKAEMENQFLFSR